MPEYSTQIDELPDNVSDISFNDDPSQIPDIPNIPTKVTKNETSFVFLDSTILFIIVTLITNKRFVRWLSNYNPKGSFVLSLILALVATVFFIIYKIILMI